MYTRKIMLAEAEPGMVLADSVYVSMSSDSADMLAAPEGATLDDKLLSLFAKRNIESIVIKSDTPPPEDEIIYLPTNRKDENEANKTEADKPKIVAKLTAPPKSARFKELMPETIESEPMISEELKEEAVESVKQLFDCFAPQDGVINKTTAYQCVAGLESVVSDLLGVISSDTTGLVHINDLKQYDEYTYHHSLSVAVLSIATGQELGLEGDDLFRLGRCAMLHDVGKQLVPLEIINKKGRLTNEEFETVKNHTILGASNLKVNELGDPELWDGVLYHHEKVNGAGYPKRLSKDEIPLFAKIISVADVYDAITSYRSYRAPMLPSEAFEIIRKDIGTAFDYDVVKAFFEKLELYPVGTVLELSDRRLGIVVDCEKNRRLRPIVRLWGSQETLNLTHHTNKDIEIVGVMQAGDIPSEA